MSETIILIKRNVVDWQSMKMKNIDTFEIFSYWNTLYLFILYSVSILVLRTMNTTSTMFSGINNNNLFLFCLKDTEKCCNICHVCWYTFFKKKKVFLIFFFFCIHCFKSKYFNISLSVSWLPNQFRKHCQSKQQPLRRERFKSFGKGGEPYMGEVSILWGDLITP